MVDEPCTFQVGDVVRHIEGQRNHAFWYFDSAESLTIRQIGPEEGENTVYYMEGFEDSKRVCRYRLELVQAARGPW